MTDKYFDQLCEMYKIKFPNGDIPHKFYLEFITYIYLNGALDCGMDSTLFAESLISIMEDENDDN